MNEPVEVIAETPKHLAEKPKIVLNPEQVARMEAIKKAIGHVAATITENLFTEDGNPERELAIWEAIVSAFQDEAKTRTKLRKFDLTEQKLLFQVLLLTSIHGYDPATLATQYPNVRALKNYQGAVHRFMKVVIDKVGPITELEEALNIEVTEKPPQVD